MEHSYRTKKIDSIRGFVIRASKSGEDTDTVDVLFDILITTVIHAIECGVRILSVNINHWLLSIAVKMWYHVAQSLLPLS